MALSSTIVWEFRASATGGAMVNGGGFKTGATGTDWSQQDAAQYALTGIASSGAGDTFLTASASADMVGNIAHVISGTNFTTGRYEIIAVSAGVSVQVDRAITTGVGANGVINIGGALVWGSATLDDAFCEAVIGGNTVYIKNGTYAIGGNISVASSSATTAVPIVVEGYNSTRGDTPTGTNRPTISGAANTTSFAASWHFKNLILATTVATGWSTGASSGFANCKILNSSSTASRVAVTGGTDCYLINCELVSQNGSCYSNTGARARVFGCYFHDSDIGYNLSGGGIVFGCIFEACRTSGIECTSVTQMTFIGNTFYGREAKIGIGINLNVASAPGNRIYNNIFYGLATGINSTTLMGSNSGGYNTFFNNTADVSNYTKDVTDIALNPTFAGATQITGTTATTSGSVLTQSGGDFSTVTDNDGDYLHIISGTGVTVGRYLITSHTATTLTVNNALGTSSGGDVVYFVTTGHNFSVGNNMKAAAIPSAMGLETTNSVAIGAVQIAGGVAKFAGNGGGFVC